ncbi:MAG: hypothetical protein M3N47_15055 [Chloroflexota bacterium]|nr:hypothetical protein [Chloroflexota bacterium]
MASGNVLLLEDDPIVRDLMTDVLTDGGHGVLPCGSFQHVLDVAADTPEAVAVVDFWGDSHQALADEERADLVRLARAVPTILVTARAWATAAISADLGLAALVRKPFDVDELATVVAGALESGRHVGVA